MCIDRVAWEPRTRPVGDVEDQDRGVLAKDCRKILRSTCLYCAKLNQVLFSHFS